VNPQAVDNDLLRSFANNGPWALAAAFLCWQILKAWGDDRKLTAGLLTEFRATMTELAAAVRALAERIDQLEAKRD